MSKRRDRKAEYAKATSARQERVAQATQPHLAEAERLHQKGYHGAARAYEVKAKAAAAKANEEYDYLEPIEDAILDNLGRFLETGEDTFIFHVNCADGLHPLNAELLAFTDMHSQLVGNPVQREGTIPIPEDLQRHFGLLEPALQGVVIDDQMSGGDTLRTVWFNIDSPVEGSDQFVRTGHVLKLAVTHPTFIE